MSTQNRTINEEEARKIRALALLEASNFFKETDPTVSKILDEFSFKASQGLDIVSDDV